jgi:hypothetical protein
MCCAPGKRPPASWAPVLATGAAREGLPPKPPGLATNEPARWPTPSHCRLPRKRVRVSDLPVTGGVVMEVRLL